MSIFFDFEVGSKGARFRRAVDADKYDIQAFIDEQYTESWFGNPDIGSLIELSTLSICLMNEQKAVVGFIALDDHPNVPALDPAGWENWIRNMFQRYYLSRATLFLRFMACTDDCLETFLEDALVSVFINDSYLLQVVILVPPTYSESLIGRYGTFKHKNLHKYCSKMQENEMQQCIYVASRQDFYPRLRIRRAVEEDNDDVVEILQQTSIKLKELYGNFYISELLGRHPTISRKIIVAEEQDRVISVMCLNTNINYEMLQNTYELELYHGLRKVTPLEKEKGKRANSLLKVFGEPIMCGKFGPYHRVRYLESIHEEDDPTTLASSPSRLSSKGVEFMANASLRRSFDQLYIQKVSDDYSGSVGVTGSNLDSEQSYYADTLPLLEEDQFDYDIVNIDANLLNVPQLSFDRESTSTSKRSSSKYFDSTEYPRLFKMDRRTSRVSFLKNSDDDMEETVIYKGEPNAFMIELFGMKEGIEGRHGFDMLEAAFEYMGDLDYCIIRVPCADKYFALLRHFCFVPTKGNETSEYALYVAHRMAVFGKLYVRPAEFLDVPQIAQLLHNLNGRETLWTVENSIRNKMRHEAYVFFSGITLIGVAILEPPEEVDYIRAKFNLDPYHMHKYHESQGFGAGFATLKTSFVYPCFEQHFRFFLRDMIRLSGKTAIIWLTGYRNKWVVHKSNCMVASMVPIMPRKSEIDCMVVPELKKINAVSKEIMAFSTWFISKKLTTIPRVNIDTRIVIVGASETAMSFINTLLFSDSSSYLTFTNVTLISVKGWPYMRQLKPEAELMFPYSRTQTDRFLKSVPYTYYVNVIQGIMVGIDEKMKYVTLANGSTCPYDQLFLFIGKQFQHPGYLKMVFDYYRRVRHGQAPRYTRVDEPRCNYTPVQLLKSYLPDNVFIVNNITVAHRALQYIRPYLRSDSEANKVIVYGASINTYCCLTALLEYGVRPQNIVFVEAFPPEHRERARIPVFANTYVDTTVQNVIEELGIKVYRSFYFEAWTKVSGNVASHVSFVSDFQHIRLGCSAFFYYGESGVNTHAFLAMVKCGMAYDGGIRIDHRFRTKNPAIYAAGPVTRYRRSYHADEKRHKYYDSTEVGEYLANQIRNDWDPLFKEGEEKLDESRMNHVTFRNERNATTNSKIILENEKPIEYRLPRFKKPLVTQCKLPGGMQYLEVRASGKKIPHHYVQSLDYSGFFMETFKQGYFKIHMTNDFIVDGVTCLTSLNIHLDNFKNIFGYSAVVLNNVHVRFLLNIKDDIVCIYLPQNKQKHIRILQDKRRWNLSYWSVLSNTNKLDDFYEFFTSPWAFFLYHENKDELFAVARELLPDNKEKDTLTEALTSIGDKLSIDPSYKDTRRLAMRSRFSKSSHVEAITAYLMEWLSENSILMPMYWQSWHLTEFDDDTERNFRRKRWSLVNIIGKTFEMK